ncbi:DUF6788 family protein [Tengunoibacter tsumagoiensis]|uniref:Bacterial transcriptional activator domain-containing protein n=1 Tax=Tengunoibacter tsumagoiensis TaxID=2014871 RepID=A0A402A5P4_9CHLR|nr:DUF6788 family protein [Tengunoibacter tsumagoiensis]GCE14448.1 hypothetical protein KTT_43070 [Tengunoibacter tsumagoiensis]
MNDKVTYHQQVSYCGKPRCRKCREGTGHGPYWYAYQTVDGRTTRTYIGKHLPAEAQAKMNGGQEPRPAHASDRDQATICIYVLGQFRLERRDPQENNDWETVTDSSWQHQRVRALLGCLVSAGRRLGREQIMEALWPDLESDAAGGRLDRAVYSLRQLFEPQRDRLANSPLLLTEREMIVLADAPKIWIDADAFEQALKRAHASADPGEKEKFFQDAANLYGGPFLPEETKNEWTLGRRETLQRSWIGLLLEQAELFIQRDALNNAIEPLNRLLSIDPTNEAAVQSLMKLLMQLGRRAEAIRAYKRLREVLQAEYHILPLPETRQIYESLLGASKRSNAASVQAEPAEPRSGEEGRSLAQRGSIASANEIAAVQIGRSHQSPLIGRERELGLLNALVNTTDTTLRYRLAAQKRTALSTLDPHRRPQSVLLLGDVGIGKTRLAEEVSREAKKRGWAVAWSRVFAQEGSIPYRLWTEVLRKAMEQGAWQRKEVATRSLTFQPLSALLPEMQEYLLPTIYATSLPPEQEQLRLWEAARELLTLISSSTPLLIVLDDLQWSDTSGCELFAYLARRIYGLPIIIVGTCRDNELDAKHPLRSIMTDLQRENALECVSLERLSNEQIASLVSQVSHIPEPLVPRISDRAAGNPFFAEELARTIGSQPTLAEELSQAVVNLPETITAVLDLRLARLSQPCYKLLSNAAVLGGSFDFNIISAMEAGSSSHGSDEDLVLDLLEEGLRSGMLTEEGTGTRITYSFWHPLLASHLYDGLSAARRARQHRKAADVLKKLYKGKEEEVAAEITSHLIKGGESSEQIAHFAELAANRSLDLCSYEDAEYYYNVALEHIPDNSEEWQRRAYILEHLGECIRVQGKYEKARIFYQKSLDHRIYYSSQDSLIDLSQEAQVQSILLCEIGQCYYNGGDMASAKKYLESSEKILNNFKDTSISAKGRLLLQQSYVIWREGDYTLARPMANEALSVLEKVINEKKLAEKNKHKYTSAERTLLGDPVEIGRVHVLLSNIEATGGKCSDALPHLNKALEIFEQYDCSREIAIVSCNLGDLYLRTAQYSQAQAALRRSLSIAERIGEIPLSSFAIGNLGILDMRLGELYEAEKEMEKAISLAESVQDPIFQSMLNSSLATVLQEQRKFPQAVSALKSALKMARATKVSPCIGLAYMTLGKFRLALALDKTEGIEEKERLKNLSRAFSTLKHVLALKGIEVETRAESRLNLVQVLLIREDFVIAHQQALNALEEAQQSELIWLIAKSQAALGCTFASINQLDQSYNYFDKSIRAFRRINMRLEYARVLFKYGEILLENSELSSKDFVKGSNFLIEAKQIFIDCKAELDSLQLNVILAKHNIF